MLSQFVYLLKSGDKPLLYHVITTKVFFITNKQYEFLKRNYDLQNVFSDQELSLLSTRGFLRDTNEFSIQDMLDLNHQDKPDVFALYLILTEECNMQCMYCSQASFRTRARQKSMSTNVIRNTLYKFYKTATKRRRTVVLYGGEPMMNPDGVRFAINYIRDDIKDDSAEIVIFTNGTLIDEEFIDYFAWKNVSVIISVDGPREINDQFRRINGEGSYDKIARTIHLFQKKKIRFGISSTIASHNLTSLGDTIRFFVDQFKPFSIGLNPLHYTPASQKKISVEVDDMASAMVKAYDVAKNCGIYVEQIMRRVRPFILGTPRLKDCPSCGGMVRVLPDGGFGPCGHFMEVGKEHETGENNFESNQTMNLWNSRLSCLMPQCSSCLSMALCGGGCPYNSFRNGGGDIFMSNDKRSCRQSEIFLLWLLNKLASEFPKDEFVEITSRDKLKLLGNIDLSQEIPLAGYSRYGEFEIDERFR